MWEILLFSVLVTSLISGVFGMGGGMILLGIYAWVLPVTSALILHGATQIASNGFRCFLHHKHIQWNVVVPYLVGGFFCFAIFWWVSYTPEKAWVFLGLGILPFLSLVIPKSSRLDVTNPWASVLCSILVTGSQILVGVSGPLLDIFYIRSKLSRFEIIATKAITQTFGHILKLAYYTNLVLHLEEEWPLPAWVFPAVIAITFLGTLLGKRILGILNEIQFRSFSTALTLMIGTAFLVRGYLYLP